MSHLTYRNPKTEITVADILREHWDEYRQQYRVTAQQAKVVGSIMACRTARLGGRLAQCKACQGWVFRFNSCRDRHCNQCQKFERAKWVEKQKVIQLPIPYFHVIFTVDHALNPVIRQNRKEFYELLFATVRQVLQEQAKAEMGCELGITAVLPTWGQQLDEHYHLHCIVTGGGLALDGSRWVRSRSPRFVLEVKELSGAYRDALCEGVRGLYRADKVSLRGTGVDMDVERVLDEVKAKKWEVFAKPFDSPDRVVEYLSRYVHQVAIANYRLLKLEGGWVTFEYYDNRDREVVGGKGKKKKKRLPAVAFIRCLMGHILPPNFHRIRYFGLHASIHRQSKLVRCRVLLGQPKALPVVKALTVLAWLKQILGEEVDRCPHCGAQGSLIHRSDFEQLSWLLLLILSLMGQPTKQGVSP